MTEITTASLVEAMVKATRQAEQDYLARPIHMAYSPREHHRAMARAALAALREAACEPRNRPFLLDVLTEKAREYEEVGMHAGATALNRLAATLRAIAGDADAR